ncbi:MAG: HAMP domain-containing sensor histidine kinase [Clostridia bacterium]
MIKKLKKKFIFTVLSLITVLLFIMFSAFFAFMSNNIKNESIDVLNECVNSNNLQFDYKYDIIFGKSDEKYSHYNIFLLEYDSLNNVITTYGIDGNLSESQKENLISLVKSVKENNLPSGVIKENNLRYSMSKRLNITKIAFLDKTYEDDTIKNLLFNLIVIGSAGIAASFALTLIISKIAINPVEKSWKQQQQLVADVSHELKTPLSVINSNAEIIASHQDSTVAEESKWLEYIKTEVARMTSLINNMLYLAKSEESLSQVQKSNLNFSEIAMAAALPFESVCFEKKLELIIDIKPNLYVYGNAEMLKQLIVIFLDNACKYSYTQKQVVIRLYKDQDKINMSVLNFGDVISFEQASHLFERFYRGDASRSNTKSGYGLGLSIAKTILDFHSAKIFLKSTESGGTDFLCVFKPL